MDSLELLTSDDEEIISNSLDLSRNEDGIVANTQDGFAENRYSNDSIEETPTFMFPPGNKTEEHIKFKKRSYEALRSIPSPTSTYMELEEEHRRKTEEILGQNSSSPLAQNKVKLLSNENKSSSGSFPASKKTILNKSFDNNEEEELFIIEHNDSEQMLATHEFKTGRHSRNYSDNRFLSLRTIRNTIHGSTSSLPQNLKSMTKDSSDSPLKSSSKRTSRLQRLKSNSISNNISFSNIKSNDKALAEDIFDESNGSSKRNTLQFYPSTNTESRTDVSTTPNNKLELQMTKEQFKIQTLLNQMKQLEIENESLKIKNDEMMFLTKPDSDEKSTVLLYEQKLKDLEDKLNTTQQELKHEVSKNEELLQIYEEEEKIIVELEEELRGYDDYTRDLINFVQTKVQNNKGSDQFQTLNNRYRIKNFEEGDTYTNFQNIYRFINQVFDLLIDSNMEKQLLREEMMHDFVDSDSVQSSKSFSPNKQKSENNSDMNQKLGKLENIVESLVEFNRNGSERTKTNNGSEAKGHDADSRKLIHLEAKLSEIYDAIQKTELHHISETNKTMENIIQENSNLKAKVKALEHTHTDNERIIEEQNTMINELYVTIDKSKEIGFKICSLLLQFSNNFIFKLLNKIENGDKESLLKPMKKLNKIEVLLSSSYDQNSNIIQGHFNALLKFIEQSIEVLIDKFNEEILDRNRTLNYIIEKNLHKKWEKQADVKTTRTLNMKK